jgi:hypothetical protein
MQACQFPIHFVKSTKQIENDSSAGEVDPEITTQALHSA